MKHRTPKALAIPLTEYVVREHWDTGYEDTNCSGADEALERKKSVISKLMMQEGMTFEGASRFVSCHLLVRIDL